MSWSSSTSTPQIPKSSASAPTEVQAWQTLLAGAAKPKSPAQIRAAGEVKVKVGVLWVVGVTTAILSIFGGAVFWAHPDSAKDIWVIIGPIITAGITGIVSFMNGEKAGASK